MTRRSIRQATLTLYQVCDNEHGVPFNSEGCTMHPSKRKALAELRETRKHFPNVYLAQITYTRLPRLILGGAEAVTSKKQRDMPA